MTPPPDELEARRRARRDDAELAAIPIDYAALPSSAGPIANPLAALDELHP